ncbi:MAG: hypothetical protein ABI837_20475, partial [Acidobacteriota bacterium]
MPIPTIVPRRLVVAVNKEPAIVKGAEARLATHLALLETFGLSGLSGLGALRIAGTAALVPRPGLLRPRTDIVDTANQRQFHRAYLWNRATGAFDITPDAKEALFLKAESFPSAAFLRTPSNAFNRALRIEDCYWAATKIEIAANTTVLLQYPNLYLTILCEELIGNINDDGMLGC